MLDSILALFLPSDWTEHWNEITEQLYDGEKWLRWLGILVKIAVIWFGSRLLIRLIKRTISHAMDRRERLPLKSDIRRGKTIGKLASSTVETVINFIAVLLILEQLGFNLWPVLAGAGVVGLAVGFGAQNLVKDVIAGFFILLEDQYSVGEMIQIRTFKGTVEEIGLRVTKIRSSTGEIHIIPNGSIVEVTNFSRNNSVGIVDVSVAYDSDLETALKIIRDTAMKVYEGNGDMVKPPEVLGVQQVGQSEVVIRLIMECNPNTQYAAGRQLMAELKKALDTVGIKML